MKLRISLEGQSYDVDVEIVPEPAPDQSEFDAVPDLPQPPPPLDIRDSDKICRSPIAGLVISVDVDIRQRVKADDPVVTIEAMKMQTAIGAPVEGTVETIHVAPGDIVKPGQILCKLS